MNRLSKPTLRMGVVLLLGYALASSASHARDSGGERKAEWKAFDVTYEMDPDYKDGPSMDWKGKKLQLFEERTSKIWIPAGMKQGETIRGVMPRGISGLEEFAYRNRIAMYDGGANQPYGCVNKTFLKAAAKVTGHPELEHAGAIQQGLSNLGRFEAHAAHFWPEKVIAVILDHSCCGGPCLKASGYNYDVCPVAEGIPFFFNASQKDMHQGIDRRACHYGWCKSAFNGKAKQPCTSVISYEDVGHGNPGTRSLQIIWLEEVLALRVPVFIDPDGAPYGLNPIDVDKVGGHVVARLSKLEGRSIHTEVQVGPIGFAKTPSWWVPGPRSAREIAEWVKKNGGMVAMDRSSELKPPALFTSMNEKLQPICALLQDSKFESARNAIDELLAKGGAKGKEDQCLVRELSFYKTWIDDRAAEIELAKAEAAKRIEGLSAISDPAARFKEATELWGIPNIGTWPEAKPLASAWLKAALEKSAGMADAIGKHEFLSGVSNDANLKLVPSSEARALTTALAELRKDPAVRKEYEADKIMQNIIKFEAQAKNKTEWQQILSGYAAVKKRYPGTGAAAKAEEGIGRAEGRINPPGR